METQTEKIAIKTEFIKLDQLLKFSGVADIGSEAKQMVLDGIVNFIPASKVNGAFPGDLVEITGEDIIIRLEVVGE